MANIYSSLITDLQTAGKRVPSYNLGGKARMFPFSFTFASAGAAPVLYMTRVWPGIRLYGICIQSSGLSASAGVALVIDIGDSGDPDRLYQVYDADVANVLVTPTRLATGFNYTYTADTWITGEVAAGKTPADTSTLHGYFLGVQE